VGVVVTVVMACVRVFMPALMLALVPIIMPVIVMAGMRVVIMRVMVVTLVPVAFVFRMIVMVVMVVLFMTVIIMVVPGMVVMAVLACMILVIMIAVAVLVMPLVGVLFIAMRMRLKQRAFAERQFRCPVDFKHFRHSRIFGKRRNGTTQPRCQLGADPKHQIGVLQRRGLGRAQAILMRAGAGLDNERRLAHAMHHARDERMDRRDIDGHVWRIRQSRASKQGCRERQGNEVSGHIRLHVII